MIPASDFRGRRFLLAVFVATACVALSVGRGALAQTQPAALVISFGPSEIWTPSTGAFQALHECGRVTFSCVQAVMQSDDASDDAITFYQLTGWFLGSIDAAPGVSGVMTGTVFNPWRANENTQPVLLGGVPAVVMPEQSAQLDNLEGEVRANQDFQSILAAHPQVLFWGSSPTLEPLQSSPSGGDRFVYDYRLLDGCHACAVLGLAQVAFDFLADGTFDGPRLLDVTPMSAH